jgi:hypothetical protein
MKQAVVFFTLLNSFFSSCAQSDSHNLLHKLNGHLTDAMIIDGFSPPMASRVYYICNVGFYEVIHQESQNYLSLAGQLNGLEELPAADEAIDLKYASTLVFKYLGEKLVYTHDGFSQAVQSLVDGMNVDESKKTASLEYADLIYKSLVTWVSKDGYDKMRAMPRYQVLHELWSWEPTPPAYVDALEPNWYHLRTATLDSVEQFKPVAPVSFSEEVGSAFYQQAYSTYETVNKLSEDELTIAKFWDCNPLQTRIEGHFMFSAKQMTPGGHWMAITGIACNAAGITDLVEVSRIYTNIAIGLYDGFIISWQCKYEHDLIRPETYINRYIDSNWRPILETPPFPEYTSAHSVISMTSAQTLNSILGEVTYVDTVETRWGYPKRTFSSFVRAAIEVSQSRVYGGIHYPMGVEHGIWQGKRLAEHIRKRLRFTKNE